VPLVYYVFDLLLVDGKDLRKEPLSARRKLLAGILKRAPPNIRLSEGLQGSKEDLLRIAQEFGLEGLVANFLLAKQLKASYPKKAVSSKRVFF
jgi:bifunctional non-homologous end joining protein LigD